MQEEARKRITGLLYDGVISRDDWYGGIDALRDALGAGFFHFFTLNTSDSTVLDSVDNQTSVGAIQKKLREYEDDGFVTQDLRMQILSKLPVGEVMLDHEHISAKEMSRNRVYADFLGTFGFRNTLGVLLRDDAGVRDYLGFIRPADYTAYGDGDKGLMQQLMPDLVRASQLRARMAELSQRAALGLAAL